MIDPGVIDRLKAITGPRGWIDDARALEPHVTEWRGLYKGKTPLMLRPATVDEVSRILALCNEALVAVVPQAGNTSLCGASVPDASGEQIILSLSRMNRVRAIDAFNATMVAEAGCVLADIHAAALAENRMFPLSFAAEGSAQLGGFLSTNAGGTNVLRYGNARDQVLGLEVVLADGRVWSGLRTLRKDNTGYDLKHLFMGAEGTLGIITAASLKLFPAPRSRVTAFLGLADVAAAISLLSLAREKSGDMVTAFELLPRAGLEMVLRHIEGTRDPLAAAHPWYVLMELSSGLDRPIVQNLADTILEAAFEAGLVQDGTVAATEGQAQELWRLREVMSETQKLEGASIKHDVAVPVSAIPQFMAEGMAAVIAHFPGSRPVPFGHVGDGNIHFNISQPVGGDGTAFLALWEEMNEVVHAAVAKYGGSISAEHGIGQLKRDLLPRYKSPVEMELMHQLKNMLDPNGIMNPGKVLARE
jgi:FAD/FMN-containing dehydrogenase